MASPLPAFSTSFGFTPLAPVMPHFWENLERLQEVVTTEQNKRKQRKTRRIVRPKKKRSQVLAQTIVKRAKKHRQKKTQTRLHHSLSQRSMATHIWSPLRYQCTATPSPHKGGVTLVNLQRQLATIRCCAKNCSSVTPHCGQFFCDICSAATRCKFLKRWCYTGQLATPTCNDTMLREKLF